MHRKVVGICAIGLLSLSACGGGGRSGADIDYQSGEAIGQELAKNGFACENLEQDKETIAVLEEWTCDHFGINISIDTFRTEDQRKAVSKAFGAFATGHEVAGDIWSVSGMESTKEAQKVADILGGKVD
jgi:hypothetical protein